MHKSWNTSGLLVIRAGFLVLLTGCGITNTRAPQPVSSGSTADTTTLASAGLQLGYVWQADQHNLYPVVGVTGASHYAPALLPAGTVPANSATMTTPGGSWALVLRSDGTLQVYTLPAMSAVTLATAVAPDAQITLSPAGVSAVITSASGASTLLVSGLPSKPQLVPVSLPSGRQLAGAAVNDAGLVLLGLRTAANSSVEVGVASATRAYAPVANLAGWGGAAFGPANSSSSADYAIAADSVSAKVIYLSNLTGAAATSKVVSTGALLQKPGSVAISADGKWALMADLAKPQIVRASLSDSSATPSAIPCACTPKNMVPLTSDGLFAMTAAGSGQPLWILDTRRSEPRAFFVPALPAGTQTASASTQANGAGR